MFGCSTHINNTSTPNFGLPICFQFGFFEYKSYILYMNHLIKIITLFITWYEKEFDTRFESGTYIKIIQEIMFIFYASLHPLIFAKI